MTPLCKDKSRMTLVAEERQRELLQMVAVNTNSSGQLLVKCGEASGLLHLNKFRCPGINEPCIVIASDFLTPKQFCRLAKRDKFRDWKGAINVGSRTLRWLMEWSILDFFQHETNCSKRCKSRILMDSWPTRPEKTVAPTTYRQDISQDPIALSASTSGDISPTFMAYSLFQPDASLKRKTSEGNYLHTKKKGKL